MLSILIQFIAQFKAMAKALEVRTNGSKEDLTYTYTAELTPEYSPDLRFESLSVDGTVVTSDVVAMDSDLPLAKWDKVSAATGDIPKIGKKMRLSERLLSDIDIMIRRSGSNAEIARKLYTPAIKLLAGVAEKLQYMYDQALSSGVMLIDDDTNTGTGIRVDFKYPAANKFGAVVPWSDPNAKPLDDLLRLKKAAKGKGVNLTVFKMDDATFDNFSRNAQVKEQFAFYNNFVGAQVPNPDLEKVNDMLRNNSQFRFQIQIMDRTVTTEKNGQRTVVPTWTPNKVVGLSSTKVGRLVYGELAEATRPAKNVEYFKALTFVLVKLWRKDEPFSENISVQALVLPVIDNASDIFLLDAEEAATDAQTEGDSAFDYKGNDYTKTSVIAALKLAKPNTKLITSSTDAAILKQVNELSDEQVAIFEANIVAVP